MATIRAVRLIAMRHRVSARERNRCSDMTGRETGDGRRETVKTRLYVDHCPAVIAAPFRRLPPPASRLPSPVSRLPSSFSLLPSPFSLFPIPDSRFPIPDDRWIYDRRHAEPLAD